MAFQGMSLPEPLVSVVVPVRGDSAALAALLADLGAVPGLDLRVAAAPPLDALHLELRQRYPHVAWIDSAPGRGVQLNAGAASARGRWLWFLHADSRVPSDWPAVFAGLDARVDVAGGAFRFRLDSSAWQARFLEAAVAARVFLLGLPYGDQGIFVRRSVFQSMGGYRPIPLMEDVEFVGRLKRHGRLVHLSQRLVTSARRWRERGWLTQSLSNLGTLGLYWLGVSPARLARRYDRRSTVE